VVFAAGWKELRVQDFGGGDPRVQERARVQAAFSVISRLLRVSWCSVARIVARVVGELGAGQRLQGLLRIGVDDVSYGAATAS
jgi:hypothetical protein